MIHAIICPEVIKCKILTKDYINNNPLSVVHMFLFICLFVPFIYLFFLSLAFAAPNPYIIAGATPTAQDPYTLGIATVAGQEILKLLHIFSFIFFD